MSSSKRKLDHKSLDHLTFNYKCTTSNEDGNIKQTDNALIGDGQRFYPLVEEFKQAPRLWSMVNVRLGVGYGYLRGKVRRDQKKRFELERETKSTQELKQISEEYEIPLKNLTPYEIRAVRRMRGF